MITWPRTIFTLLVLGLTGCIPFVLEGKTRHFAPSEYSYPLTDGMYVVEGQGLSSIRLVAQADHVTATLTEKGRETTLIGGFIALGTPGHFIFQATDATENGKAVSKAPEDATYIPMRVANNGQATWFTDPEHCDAECSRLLQDHGFLLVAGAWKGTTMLRVSG